MGVEEGWAVTGAGSALEVGAAAGPDPDPDQNATHWHDVVAIVACPPQSSSCSRVARLGGLNGTAVPIPEACGTGYDSRLCASCAPSYRRESSGQCSQCATTTMAAGGGAALLGLLLLLAVAHAVRRSGALAARLARFRTGASLVWGLVWQSVRIDVSLLQVGRPPRPRGGPPAPGHRRGGTRRAIGLRAPCRTPPQIVSATRSVLRLEFVPAMQGALASVESLLRVDASAFVQLECVFGLSHSYARSWLISQLALPAVVGALILLWYTYKRGRGDEHASAGAFNAAFLAVFLM